MITIKLMVPYYIIFIILGRETLTMPSQQRMQQPTAGIEFEISSHTNNVLPLLPTFLGRSSMSSANTWNNE